MANADALLTVAQAEADRAWAEIVPILHDYIRIPALSPAFDPEWADHGHLDAAVALVRDWLAARPIEGLKVDVHRLAGRTPVVIAEIPATRPDLAGDTVLLYGHLDKQPEFDGWRAGFGPWEPVLEGERLYGRGGADDGYAAFASLAAIEAVRAAGGDHARCVLVIEASEESGSIDLPAHVDALAEWLGAPSLVLCLDSGCGDFERLWVTTSLRGLAGGRLEVEILTEGVHSGEASGVVPSSFRILRTLLDRVDDAGTGMVRLDELHAAIPAARVAQARAAIDALGHGPADDFPFVPGARPTVDDAVEQALNRTWRPALSITGADGLPPTARAGNVLRPSTALQLSVRLPPPIDATLAADALRTALTADPPYGARVTFAADHVASGWDAAPFAPWLDAALDRASHACFGAPAASFGEGGSIPFIAMLAERFPGAQFVVTGVLGPGTNAHGPNEFLHVPTGRRLTASLAAVLAAHGQRDR